MMKPLRMTGEAAEAEPRRDEEEEVVEEMDEARLRLLPALAIRAE